MKIMTILLLTAVTMNANAYISKSSIADAMHELFCATPAEDMAEALRARNPRITAAELAQAADLRGVFLSGLKTSSAAAAKFDRNVEKYMDIYKRLEARDAGEATALLSHPIGAVYGACQVAADMSPGVASHGCPGAGMNAKSLRASVAACASLLAKSKRLSTATTK